MPKKFLPIEDAFFRQMVDSLPQMVWTCDAEGKHDYASPKWLAYVGAFASEQRGGKWFTRVHPEDRERWRQAWRRAQSQGTELQLEIRIRRHDGCYRWMETRVVPLRDEEGHVVKWFGTHTDIQEQREQHEALRASVEHLRLATEAAQIGTWERDLNTNRLVWSAHQERLMGYAPGTFPNTYEAFFLLVHPENQAKLAAAQRVARDTGHYHAELRFRLPDGRERWGLLRGQMIYDRAGRPARLVGIDLDISERKRDEAALRHGYEQLRVLIEQAPVSIAMFDREMRYLAASRRWKTNFDRAEQDLIGQLHYDVFPDLPEKWKRVHQKALAGATFKQDEDEWQQTNGKRLWSRWAVHPWRDAYGAIGGIIISTEDITLHKQAEEKLRESDERLKLTLAAARMGVWEWCVRTNAVFWSPECYEITGTESFDGTLEGFTKMVHPADQERVMLNVERAITEKTVFATEFRIIRPDGRELWLLNLGRAQYDLQGNPTRMLGIAQDITERKQNEVELEQSLEQVRLLALHLQDVREEERKRIARELHDELGQALASLKYGLAELEQQTKHPATARALKKKTQTMSKLIDSTIQIGRQIATELRPRVLDDLGLIAALRWQARDFQLRTGLTCNFIASTEDLTLEVGQATAVFRICQETLTNVLRHAQATAVTIHLQVENECLRLEIKDNGRGISRQDINRRGSHGLLGMKERVLPYGGTFDIVGRAGEGTGVTVLLPLIVA